MKLKVARSVRTPDFYYIQNFYTEEEYLRDIALGNAELCSGGNIRILMHVDDLYLVSQTDLDLFYNMEIDGLRFFPLIPNGRLLYDYSNQRQD